MFHGVSKALLYRLHDQTSDLTMNLDGTIHLFYLCRKNYNDKKEEEEKSLNMSFFATS